MSLELGDIDTSFDGEDVSMQSGDMAVGLCEKVSAISVPSSDFAASQPSFTQLSVRRDIDHGIKPTDVGIGREHPSNTPPSNAPRQAVAQHLQVFDGVLSHLESLDVTDTNTILEYFFKGRPLDMLSADDVLHVRDEGHGNLVNLRNRAQTENLGEIMMLVNGRRISLNTRINRAIRVHFLMMTSLVMAVQGREMQSQQDVVEVERMYGANFTKVAQVPTERLDKLTSHCYDIAAAMRLKKLDADVYAPFVREGQSTGVYRLRCSIEEFVWSCFDRDGQSELYRELLKHMSLVSPIVKVLQGGRSIDLPNLSVARHLVSTPYGVLNTNTLTFTPLDAFAATVSAPRAFLPYSLPDDVIDPTTGQLADGVNPDSFPTPVFDLVLDTQHMFGDTNARAASARQYDASCTCLVRYADTYPDERVDCRAFMPRDALVTMNNAAHARDRVFGDLGGAYNIDSPHAIGDKTTLRAKSVTLRQAVYQWILMTNAIAEETTVLQSLYRQVSTGAMPINDGIANVKHSRALLRKLRARQHLWHGRLSNYLAVSKDDIVADVSWRDTACSCLGCLTHGSSQHDALLSEAAPDLPPFNCEFCRDLYDVLDTCSGETRKRIFSSFGPQHFHQGRWRAGKEPWRTHMRWMCEEELRQSRVMMGLLGMMNFSIGQSQFKCLPFLYGQGGTGKSLITETVQRWFQQKDVAALESNCSERFWLANLFKKMIYVVGELGTNTHINTDTLKKMVMGEIVTVDQKNMQQVDIRWEAPGMISSNEFNIRDSKGSIIRRLWLFWFKVFPRSRDSTLEDKVKLETSCMLMRCLMWYHTLNGEVKMPHEFNAHVVRSSLENYVGEVVHRTRDQLQGHLDTFVGFLRDVANNLRFSTRTPGTTDAGIDDVEMSEDDSDDDDDELYIPEATLLTSYAAWCSRRRKRARTVEPNDFVYKMFGLTIDAITPRCWPDSTQNPIPIRQCYVVGVTLMNPQDGARGHSHHQGSRKGHQSEGADYKAAADPPS